MEKHDNYSDNSISQNSNVENEIEKDNTSFDEDIENFPKIDTNSKIIKNEDFQKILEKYSNLQIEFFSQREEITNTILILSNSKRESISNQDYMKIYSSYFSAFDKIRMRLKIPSDIERIKNLLPYSIKKIVELNISIFDKCEEHCEDIKDFLISFNHTEIDEFWIEGYYKCRDFKIVDSRFCYVSCFFKIFLNVSPFFLGLRDVISKTIRKIHISYFEFDSVEFSKIIRAARYARDLRFWGCKIVTDSEFYFGDREKWKITELTIDNKSVYEDFNYYKTDTINILKAVLGCSTLINNLITLNLYCLSSLEKELVNLANNILKDAKEGTNLKLNFR